MFIKQRLGNLNELASCNPPGNRDKAEKTLKIDHKLTRPFFVTNFSSQMELDSRHF